jgi:tyrosine-protein kinase Etk/Wzc
MAATHSPNLTGKNMNARNPLATSVMPPSQPQFDDEDGINLIEYWDIIVDNRWLIALIATLAVVIGVGYAFLTRPIYEANLLIQVEESPGSTKNLFGDAAALFDFKTPAAAEMEIIRSRMVIGKAVDDTKLYIDARPRYLPVVGNWLARRAHTLSDPGFLGIGGFVSGTEKIAVTAFEVPPKFEASRFTVTATGGGRYTVVSPALPEALKGLVGTPLVANTTAGPITLLVQTLEGKPGAEFHLTKASRLKTIENLQSSLKLAEKGRQSGVIEATLQSSDARELALILNQIGREYVHQNVERKTAEAEKMLAFVDLQMPQFKKELDQSEEAYSRYRNQKGTISLDDEAKAVLTQEVDLQTKLLEARQKRVELLSRFTAGHPAVQTLDQQIAGWSQQIAILHARVRTMPAVQQDALRLERDVKVNNEAYQSLRNNALQLQLIREGKVGNVRLIDDAVEPEVPVRPRRGLIVATAALLGLLAGIALALAKSALNRGVRDPQEVEARTGLSVYSTIPLSSTQTALGRTVAERRPGVHLLAVQNPQDPAVESLRSLRTALQFAMLDASDNRVLITGATPGVGKSFVSANFAAILAGAGRRVLLIDADMRKGHLNHFFGVARENGLSEVIAGTMTVSEVTRRNLLPQLDLLTTGVLPPNPAELMMSAALAKVLEDVSSQYDFVIVDTPPVLVAADTVGVAAHAGTVLLVARAGVTQMGEINESAKRLAHAGKTLTGVLFNAMDLNRRYYGSYGYKYGGYKYAQYSYEQH